MQIHARIDQFFGRRSFSPIKSVNNLVIAIESTSDLILHILIVVVDRCVMQVNQRDNKDIGRQRNSKR